MIKQFQIYAYWNKKLFAFFRLVYSFVSKSVNNKNQKLENFVYFIVFFDEDENASQAAEIVNGDYGPDTVIINYM